MFGKYAIFIIPSYLITFGAILALILWIGFVYRSRVKEIARLEKQISSGKQNRGGES